MPKFTLDQKRLETLRRQLYGKGEQSIAKKKSYPRKEPVAQQRQEPISNSSHLTPPRNSFSTKLTTPLVTVQDTNFLKKDLLKILALTSLAIGSQLVLFIALQNKLVKLF